MPFTKITKEQMDGEGYVAEITTDAERREELETRIAEAQAAADAVVAELGLSASADGRAAREDTARSDRDAAATALEQAQRQLSEARAASDDNRAAQTKQTAKLAELREDEFDANEALSRAYDGIGQPPELTPREAEWLALFSEHSKTPPSETMLLKGNLDKARKKTLAAQRELDEIETAYSDLVAAVATAEELVSTRDDAAKEASFAHRSLKSSHQYVAYLSKAVSALTAQREAPGGGDFSLVAALLPFHRLIGELVPILDSLVDAEEVTGPFHTAAATARATLGAQQSAVEALDGLTGAAVKTALPRLAAIGAALNTLTDETDAMQSTGLAASRMTYVQAECAARLTEHAGGNRYKTRFLDKYKAKMETAIGKLNMADWDASRAKADVIYDKVANLLDGEAAETQAAEVRRALKTRDFTEHEARLTKADAAKSFKKNAVYNLRVMVRTDSVDHETFRAELDRMLAKAQTAEDAARAAATLRDNIARGFIVPVSEWRKVLRLPSSSYNLSGEQKGVYDGKTWEVHLRASATSIVRNTNTLDMRGANRVDVYNYLLIDSVEWLYRVHATFRIDPGAISSSEEAEDRPAHIYLGETSVYNRSIIPSAIRGDIITRMQRLLDNYRTFAIGAISEKLK